MSQSNKSFIYRPTYLIRKAKEEFLNFRPDIFHTCQQVNHYILMLKQKCEVPVSYTHLTLPTILLV